MQALLSTKPRVVVETHVKEMADAIGAEVAATDPDLVIASQWNMASYAHSFAGRRALLEELELGSFESLAAEASGPVAKLRHTLPLMKMRRYVREILPSFAACTVVSGQEAAGVRRAAGSYDSIEVIPNFVDLRGQTDFEGRSGGPGLIFTGSLTYFPNRHGIDWFLNRVYGSVRRAVPGVSLAITGRSLNGRHSGFLGVSQTGYVEDVRPLVARARASIVPIWLGGGTRLKVLESMALRTPVVSTSKGVEGLDVIHGEHALIADEPDVFADAVVWLLTDDRLRRRLAENAYELVRSRYDYSVVMPRFLDVVERAAGIQ